MIERSIIFKREMVDAIRKREKTQTRREIKNPEQWQLEEQETGVVTFEDKYGEHHNVLTVCPFGKVGDRLWVRENFKVTHLFESCNGNCTSEGTPFCECNPPECRVEYEDSTTRDVELDVGDEYAPDTLIQARRAYAKKSVPSIHMPRWASRILLEITDLRVERLKDIPEEDAASEGVPARLLQDESAHFTSYKYGFLRLWDEISGKESTDSNPWVWVVEFKVLEAD